MQSGPTYFGPLSEGISQEVVVHGIFPYVAEKCTFLSISKEIRASCISTEASIYWRDYPFRVCIDSYCSPVCPMKKKTRSVKGALSLLKSVPLCKLEMHCFVTDIPKCLSVLSARRTVESINLTVTNKANSPPLNELIPSSLSSSMFPKMKTLVLDSSHLQHVNPEGRIKLLRILGMELDSLSFIGLSPIKIFSHINELCPKLKHLRIDKLPSLEELETFENDTVQKLELCRSNFILCKRLKFSNLLHLRYSPNCKHDLIQYQRMITYLPITLRELILEIPSDYASNILISISNHLHHLNYLRLEGSYVTGTISEQSLIHLSNGCLHLQHFELYAAVSVNVIEFKFKNIITKFALFHHLERIEVMYEDMIITDIPILLNLTSNIKIIYLWARKRWVTSPWEVMESKLQEIQLCYPHVRIELKDIY